VATENCLPREESWTRSINIKKKYRKLQPRTIVRFEKALKMTTTEKGEDSEKVRREFSSKGGGDDSLLLQKIKEDVREGESELRTRNSRLLSPNVIGGV